MYTALKGFSFGLIAAMWVIFLTQHHGLSLAQASLVDVTFFVAAAFGEVPTGIVADCRSSDAQGFVRQQSMGWTHKVEERFRKAKVRSHARLAAAWLYACGRSGSKNQCPVPL